MIQLPVDWLSSFISCILFYFRSIFISYQHRWNNFYNFRALLIQIQHYSKLKRDFLQIRAYNPLNDQNLLNIFSQSDLSLFNLAIFYLVYQVKFN